MVPKCFYGENADVFPGVVARSKAAQEYEKFLQKTIYPYIIHPHSKFRVYWEIAILLLTLCQIIFFFPIWAFCDHRALPYQLLVNLTLGIHFADFVLMFFTGYVERGTEIVVFGVKQIALRYLQRTFILDFLASLPVELCVYIFNEENIVINPWEITKPSQFVIYSTVLQIFLRVVSAVRYLENTSRVMFWNPFFFSPIAIISYFFIIINFQFTCIFFLFYLYGAPIEFVRDMKTLVHYILFFYEFVAMFFYDIPIGLQWYCLVRIPTLILGFFFTVYMTAYLIKYARFKMRAAERFYTLESDVRIFARKTRLPVSTKHKTFLYFKVFVQSKHYKEDEMFNYFPEAFKADIFSHLSLSLLKGFYAFQELPIYVLRRLAENLRYQLYLPNEVVMMKGEKKLSMYFVQAGTVALYAAKNTELYHFEDGGSFNGKNFMDGAFSKEYYAVSLEVSEVYRLDRDDFLEVMSAYPKLLEKLRETFYRDMVQDHI